MTADEQAAWERAGQIAQILQSVLAQLQQRGLVLTVEDVVRAFALQFAFAHLNNGVSIDGLPSLVRDALGSPVGGLMRAGIEAKGGPQTRPV